MRPITLAVTVIIVLASPLARADDDEPAEPADTTETAEPPEPPAVSIGGYVETYYVLNLRRPSNGINNARLFDARDRTFTLSNVALDVKAERGPVLARVILQVGATPSTYYQLEPSLPGAFGVNANDGGVWRYLQQASLAYVTSSGMVVDAGIFTSPIGPELLAIKDNWNWSRSNLFFGLPAYHAGVRLARPFGAHWVGMVHLYNGWNSVVDNNRYPSVGLSAVYAGAKLSGQVLYFGGIERPTGAPEGKAWRNLLDAYATVAVSDQLSLQAQVDAGVEPNDLGTSKWFGGAIYARAQLTPKLYGALRADYVREWVAHRGAMTASPILLPTDWMASATATLAFQPIDGLSIRLELRDDHAKTEVFFGGDVAGDGVVMPYIPNRKAQDTITLGATAWF